MSDELLIFDEIELSEGDGFIGYICLNKPKAFNAIDLEMVRLMQIRLDAWKDDPRLAFIFLEGSGDKAFCAGGDVKGLYSGRVDTEEGIDNPSAIEFFDEEYSLDFDLHTFPKPIICWGNGVVMGGGLGLMLGCDHRIATESTRSAMPEITIGLFPDVGGSWFLNRSPGKSGLFLGLTGANINAHDAIYAGLANRFILHEHKDALLDELKTLNLAKVQSGALTLTLKRYQTLSESSLPESELKKHAELIDSCCDFESVSEIAKAIQQEANKSDSAWLKKAAETLAKGCPKTAHLVLQQLLRARYLSLEEVFVMERNISAQCMKSPDFYEGVRALLIDKDQQPKWTHASLGEVDSDYIEQYF